MSVPTSDDHIADEWSQSSDPSTVQLDLHERYGYLVSYSQPAPGITAELFLRTASGQQSRFYWNDGQDPVIFAGVGTAVELTAWGDQRYESIQAQAAELFENAIISNAREPLARPRLFGGFAFRNDFIPDNTWAVFHPAHFVLPHYQLLQHGDEVWLTINAQLPQDESPAELLPALQQALEIRYQQLLDIVASTPSQPISAGSSQACRLKPFDITYPMSYPQWKEMITAATDVMQDPHNPLAKVVLARVAEIRAEETIDVDRALAYLNDTYSGCYRFLFEPQPNHAFYGATPELLAQVNGHQLKTMALAGSSPRGKTAEADEAYARELFESAKDRYEHDVVVQALKNRLVDITTDLEIDTEPQIYRLSNIHHLHTPVQARLKNAQGVLPIIKLLHPTPALGGQPRKLAMTFIQEKEPITRGWYAAPIGWLDHNLDGVFGVAIRSAVAQENRVWAYAGAGMVADSVPQKEWQETALKFRPMLDALGGSL